MPDKTMDELAMEQLRTIWVNLNMQNGKTFQITCTKRILGGGGIARSYATEQEVTNVLAAFGFAKEVIANRLGVLREANADGIRPYELVEVGELQIPDDPLHTYGFVI